MVLMDLNSSNTIRLKEFLRNLEKSLIDTDLIRAKHIEFFIKTINILNRSK
jgi:hypothetical protein